eukprot:2917759-Pyramimonas_sp.AAC.1
MESQVRTLQVESLLGTPLVQPCCPTKESTSGVPLGTLLQASLGILRVESTRSPKRRPNGRRHAGKPYTESLNMCSPG